MSPSSRPIVPPKLSTVGTYKQVSGANFISLSEDDRASLNLDSSPAALLAFHPRETLSFGGTARIQVLQGSIELFGSILHPSGTSHLVFAPRSYALPVIAALLPPSHVASTLPEKLRSQVEDYEIVIVIQELNTGVEGLGRVCPTFASVFDGPDDEDWGIRGFHPVSRLQDDYTTPLMARRSYETLGTSILSPCQLHGTWQSHTSLPPTVTMRHYRPCLVLHWYGG